ncbi:DUF5927 domain-containing protein [Pseudoprimorskyibacter insulae]|uniref:Peptide O-xylosyltransferase n=1 Tax=Pseudoprimorskyibacter insulae TaxID=1695997 RepID=A0A2R8AU25_9RHOB|nr:beta-1,6-N-acetylglucosaminyltransferase [Pseudoprimorskyibacter insulae]SPF79369.1 hypothetical protein PRI8871_01164 [Pseudoprimorskyibacter insulae]
MSTLGIVMLVHTAFRRAEQVARHWANAGCPVVIHVDKAVPSAAYDHFAGKLADLPGVTLGPRYRCEWGTWGIVAASQAASQLLLDQHPEVRHVYLTSGSCLPLRPVGELIEYLNARPDTDFIESATTADVPWTVGGLEAERFTLHFPFSWRKRRALFDNFVALQRRLRVRRKIPEGLVPHMGSQWWCLTRDTLSAILNDPKRSQYDTYFRRVWIPDESYFQTMARVHAKKVESRSLTLSKFDIQGKPHVFYDDHLQLLRRSDCFVARKIWPKADGLYRAFLTDPDRALKRTEPNPGKIDRIFTRAVDRRTRGRPGLYMASRYPNHGWEHGITAWPYSVFQGFDDLFENFGGWLNRTAGARVHGHLFARDRVHFAGDADTFNGAMTDNAKLRDANPKAFLTNVIWNTRGERQCILFSPRDRQAVLHDMVRDPNAQISVISGAWAVPLFKSNANFGDIRKRAALLQKIENEALQLLQAHHVQARVRIWSLAEFIEAPLEPLQAIIEEIAHLPDNRLREAPHMTDLAGFGPFLQRLKNEGMHPYLMGDFPAEARTASAGDRPRKPYLVKKS